jgi:hypothetical protein
MIIKGGFGNEAAFFVFIRTVFRGRFAPQQQT